MTMDELVTLRNHRKIFVRYGFHVGGKTSVYQSEAHNWFEKETRTSCSFGGSTTTFVLLRCIFTHITPIFVFLPLLLLLNGNQLDAARQGVMVLWKIQFQAFMLSRQQQ